MSKFLRYRGEFLSHAGARWRIDILQEAEKEFESVGNLSFEAEEPLVIDWKHTDKEVVICGSEATIRIESPGDRTFEDLYTIEVGQIRMDVYRNGVLYWSGALDAEFYEEPYERAKDYPVSLTFSDFGILDRLKYNLSGMQTLHDILLNALQRSGINYTALDADTYCSTYFEDGAKANPAALAVRSENFFDEDGKPSTLKEAVEGILQPLGLRIIQRAGKIYVYDLNGLHGKAPSRAVEWDGSTQTMGVDKVANNVRLNFSPYSSSEVLGSDLQYNDVYTTDLTKLTSDGDDYFSYYPDYGTDHRQGTDWDYRLINFTIFISSKGSGLAYLNPNARYFHIQPMLNGPSEVTGVAWSFHTGGHGALTTGWPKRKLNAVGKGSSAVVMKTNRVFIPKLDSTTQKEYYLRLTLEMLLDARYNPFTDANDGNEKGNYNAFNAVTGWAFVPVGITMYDAQGNALCHYDNKDKTEKATQGNFYWSMEGCGWKEGAASFGDCWLSYYNPEDMKEKAGILGWKANRQNIGRPDSYDRIKNGYFPSNQDRLYMYDSFAAQPDGEYIVYPTEGGYLEVVVYSGVRCFDYGESIFGVSGYGFDTTVQWDKKALYDKIRWMLYKAPKVELVKNNLVFDAAELTDVEYSGYINKAAKDEISIDTICGTANRTCPTAKGVYCRASDSLQIQKLQRAGVTDHPEKLFIGTMYSQFAGRKTTLSGEAVIDAGALCKYTERNQPGKVFIMSGEVQNAIMDTAESTYTEFNADEYEAIEEVS